MRIPLSYILIITLIIISLSGCSSSKKATSMKAKEKHYAKESKSYKSLNKYCEDWIGTPHKMGGMNKDGVDCSGFVQIVYKDVFGISLPRMAKDMEKAVETINNIESLEAGDLVFFNGKSGSVNHVGIYLKDSIFIHTSSSKGVMRSKLSEKYWNNIYRKGGRHPQKK